MKENGHLCGEPHGRPVTVDAMVSSEGLPEMIFFC
jgi:hypothetical protein